MWSVAPYARVEQDEAAGRFLAQGGLDKGKTDYVLYNLLQEQLAHIRLPLRAAYQDRVREIAGQRHSSVPQRRSRTSALCRMATYARFMEDFTGKRYPAGDFWTKTAGVVAPTTARCVHHRPAQGAGLAMQGHLYVCGKDMQADTVTVGPGGDAVRPSSYADEGELDRHSGADRAAAGHSPHPVPSGGAGRYRLPGKMWLPGWNLMTPYARSGRGVSGRHGAGRRHHHPRENGAMQISIPRSCCWARKP